MALRQVSNVKQRDWKCPHPPDPGSPFLWNSKRSIIFKQAQPQQTRRCCVPLPNLWIRARKDWGQGFVYMGNHRYDTKYDSGLGSALFIHMQSMLQYVASEFSPFSRVTFLPTFVSLRCYAFASWDTFLARCGALD